MFKRLIPLMLVMTFIFAVWAEAAQNRYPVKSGYIKYAVDGQSKGTEEIYWDNHGHQEARYTKTVTTVPMFGMQQNTNTVYYIDGDWAYSVNPNTNTGTKFDHKAMMEKMTGGESQKPMNFTEDMIRVFGGVEVGTETVLGKKAKIYDLKNVGDYRVWVYKGLLLKAKADFMGFKHSMVAVELKENIKVDRAKLILPSNVQITHQEDLAEVPDAEEMKSAMRVMNQAKGSPEYQEAVQAFREIQDDPEMQAMFREVQQMQNDPEMQETMRKIEQMQNDPEMQKVIQQIKEAQDAYVAQATGDPAAPQATSVYSESDSVVDAATEIIVEEAAQSGEEALRDETRKGMKKAVGGLFKKLF